MCTIAFKTKNLILGTATPIQTEVSELWDLLEILNRGGDFVLGRPPHTNWCDPEKSLPFVKGESILDDERGPGNG